MAGSVEQATDHVATLRGVVDRAGGDGFEVLLAGQGALNADFNTIAEEDLRQGETIGVVVALVVLVAVFGAVVAALLPIGLAVLAIAAAIGLVALLGLVFDFSFFVTNMITMMGLAVTIDYSLFIVSRFREERRAGHARLDAIELAGATASRAVLFSGMTVVLALVGMLLVPTTIFRSLAGGAILVVIAAVAAALTLLPALLGLLGDRVDALRVRRRSSPGRQRRGGIWVAISRAAMRRPVLSLLAAVAFLVVASTSVFDLRTGFAGVSTLPDDFASKRAFTVLATEFSGGLTTPVEVVVDGDADDRRVRQGVARLRALLAADRVRLAIEREAKQKNQTLEQVTTRARKIGNEIAADYSNSSINFLRLILSGVWNKIFKGIETRGLERVRELAQSHVIIYLPAHRSHADYLLLSYVLYLGGLVPPHIAAGENLNITFGIGALLRRCGAFFMRRKFGGDALYTAVFRAYVDSLLQRGYPIEFFPEGGRSRTGRLLAPKTGLMAMVVEAALRQRARKVLFVPVHIGYDRVWEINSYLKELKGAQKEKES
ncbi:MAG: MMPL family transporter, partial [Panacagrimonas sp.]